MSDMKVFGKLKFLPDEELKETFDSSNPGDFFVAGFYDYIQQELVLFRGNGEKLIVPSSFFEPNAKYVPDFNDFDIIDFGQTIKLGFYEASNRSILKEYDEDYNRRCIENDNSIGAGEEVFNKTSSE